MIFFTLKNRFLLVKMFSHFFDIYYCFYRVCIIIIAYYQGLLCRIRITVENVFHFLNKVFCCFVFSFSIAMVTCGINALLVRVISLSVIIINVSTSINI